MVSSQASILLGDQLTAYLYFGHNYELLEIHKSIFAVHDSAQLHGAPCRIRTYGVTFVIPAYKAGAIGQLCERSIIGHRGRARTFKIKPDSKSGPLPITGLLGDIIGASERIRTFTPLRTLTSKDSAATITPHSQI